MKKQSLILALALISSVTFFACNKSQTSNKTTAACTNSDSSKVFTKDSCAIFIPNIFSPNNDGINDLFIPLHRNLTGYSLVVKDGTTILFSSNNPNTGWDGQSSNTLMPAGSYTAEITATVCGTVINWNTCFYLAEYNTANCIPKPTTTQLIFNDQIDPVTMTGVFPSGDDLCP